MATLAGWILDGRLKPGHALPNEEELAVRFWVSRSSVREAVKTLVAKGLIETRQRVGARVRRRADWRLLDPVVLSWHPDIRADKDLLRSLIETRRIIEPAAARLAAERASAAEISVIETALRALDRAPPGDRTAVCEADLAFHRSIVEASHNLVLQGLMVTIEAALRSTYTASRALTFKSEQEMVVHRAVRDAIAARQPDAAEAAMTRLLDTAMATLLASVDGSVA